MLALARGTALLAVAVLCSSSVSARHVSGSRTAFAPAPAIWSTLTPSLRNGLPLPHGGRSGGRGGAAGPVMMAKKVVPRKASKGFGAKKKIVKNNVKELDDAKTEALFDWLREGGSSVSKVAIADFKGLRGVAARQVIEEGEAIVSIPQGLALNLGSDGINPGYAAATLCKIEKSEERRQHGWFQPFLDVLPTYEQCDTTDFFSEQELKAFEWEPVESETAERLAMLRSTYDASQIQGVQRAKHDDMTWEEYMWGVYQVVSRVLTIQREGQEGEKFLIPMIDMFNHDPRSVHQLKCTQGTFKVIAGKRINVGEQINILYGGGVLNNDRLIQDYGFLQQDNQFDVEQLTAKKTKEPMAGYPFKGMGMDEAGLKEMLAGFSTTLEDDVKALEEDKFESARMRTAVLFRSEKKKAISAALQEVTKA